VKVCIIGAGVVGSYLAKKLSKENYEIAVVDCDASKLEQLTYNYDILAVNCDALNVNCLKEVENFELFVVVTESEEKNIAIATLLKALFKKDKIIIRVSNKAFSSPPVKELLGCEAVNILSETVQSVIYQIKYPFARGVVKLEKEGIVILVYAVGIDDFLAGKQIAELKEYRNEVPFTIVAIEREGKTVIPSGQTFIYPKDVVYVALKEEDVKRFVEVLKINYSPVKTVFVFGYSRFTEELLTKLSDFSDINVKFISPEMEVCEKISGQFPGVSVFHGEFTDMELLKEEKIGEADFSIAMTEDEETNILTSILAKRLGCKKVAALIMHPEYESLIGSIGVDVPLAPRKLLASKVYTQLSSKSILEFLEISEDLDIVEKMVSEKMDGVKVSEMDRDYCGLIIAVKRDREAEIVKGDTILHSGDIIVCVEKR